MGKRLKLLYIALTFTAILLPTVCMPVWKETANSENRRLASMPSLKKSDGSLNVDILHELGDYYQDHFAFRSGLVTANSLLSTKLFSVSSNDSVIYGKNGWMYYQDSLDDYLGRHLLDEREIFNIAHSMRLLQDYVEKHKVHFLYVPVPNKNTLYGDNMPYYDSYRASEEKNILNLYNEMDREGVSYLNMIDVLSGSDETLYHETDSHWTNMGAAIASDAILDEIGFPHNEWSKEPYHTKVDFEGDLKNMLYPAISQPEEEIYFDKQYSYEYVNEIESNFDPKIYTTSEGKPASAVVYRDSFGNALLPFLADAFGKAYFSRSIPYRAEDLASNKANILIIERAERFLENTAQNPPLSQGERLESVPEGTALAYTAEIGKEKEWNDNISYSINGKYIQIDGYLNHTEGIPYNSKIYVKFDTGDVYEAFPATIVRDAEKHPYGFRIYIPADDTERRSLSVYTGI